MFARATIKYQGVYNAIIEIYPKFVLFGRMKKKVGFFIGRDHTCGPMRDDRFIRGLWNNS